MQKLQTQVLQCVMIETLLESLILLYLPYTKFCISLVPQNESVVLLSNVVTR